ncbi:DUF502 domain-containing protein [Haloarculaceae archaeon H-GB11]|nr:DUF502 domain-containing protein [Haloarculaceae archaeon H-GB11]
MSSILDGSLSADRSAREYVRQAFVTGTAVVIPTIVTFAVLGVVVNVVSQTLNPVVDVFESLFGRNITSEFVLKLIALVTLLALIFVIGAFAERRPDRSGIGYLFDTAMTRLPGVGSIYQGVDEMSDLLLDSDTESFREVKLVEFPTEGSYSLAFLTAETPDVVGDATPHDDMQTLFLPMAPNPVMGGYVIHVSDDRVYDVDMTVEEGIQSIVTSGVATGNRERGDVTEGMRDRLDRMLDDTVVKLDQVATDASDHLDDTLADATDRNLSEPSRRARENALEDDDAK